MTHAPALSKILETQGPFEPSGMTLADARSIARSFYVDANGYRSVPKLLTYPDAQLKLGKSKRYTVGLTLAAADMSGYNVCQWSTAGCRAVCVLTTGGKGKLRSVREARTVKTRFLAEHPQAFVTLLVAELERVAADHDGVDFRPNVASDLRWERIAPSLFAIDGVRVYDYTKAPASQRTAGTNYRLTFSVSERDRSVAEALDYLRSGGNAAVVFATMKGHELPATWNGFTVADGDVTDSRADDEAGTVIGLRAKGDARGGGDATGFVKAAVAS